MFPRVYYALRYFAARFFPQSQGDAPVVPSDGSPVVATAGVSGRVSATAGASHKVAASVGLRRTP